MADAGKPAATPRGLGSAGRKLWRSVTSEYDLDQHELILLLAAARTADMMDDLAAELDGAPLTVADRWGGQAVNPLAAEARQQSLTLARLLASLRLPQGDEADLARPQRRGGARGAYGVRAVS